MTARQQLARLLPLALLAVLVFAGLRGAVPAPRWNGPLRADGVAHRVTLRPELWVRQVSADDVVTRLLAAVPTPRTDPRADPAGVRRGARAVTG